MSDTPPRPPGSALFTTLGKHVQLDDSPSPARKRRALDALPHEDREKVDQILRREIPNRVAQQEPLRDDVEAVQTLRENISTTLTTDLSASF